MSDQNAQHGESRPVEARATRPPRRRRAGPRRSPKSPDYTMVDNCWVSRAEARRRGLLAE